MKRFTRVDILVVAVIFLIAILLVPVLRSRTREAAKRRHCAAHLAQIGKIMFLYAGDHDGALPRAGGPTTVWGPTHSWVALNRKAAFGLDADGNGGRATISASLYLLVKYYDVPTKFFVCPGDEGTTEFDLQKLIGVVPSFTLARAWDFGPVGESFKHCSYSYHLPYGPFALTVSRDLNLAVAADRNPWIESPASDAADVALFKPDLPQFRGTERQARAGNSRAHGLEGQNVFFLDGRVTFEKRSFCALRDDNIYLQSFYYVNHGSATGAPPFPGRQPTSAGDSLLVHDPPVWGSVTADNRQYSPHNNDLILSGLSHLHDPYTARGLMVIDDFETYADNDRRLYEVWSDGWRHNNGALAGYRRAPFAEMTVVHGGQQSMPFDYNNAESPWYSEAQASWKTPVNLAATGYDTLTLCVRGLAENSPARFYVGIEDQARRVGIVAHHDPTVVTTMRWVKWGIMLRDFAHAGVDLTCVATIYIGVGDRERPVPAGAGRLYIDDICLSKSLRGQESSAVPK